MITDSYELTRSSNRISKDGVSKTHYYIETDGQETKLDLTGEKIKALSKRPDFKRESNPITVRLNGEKRSFVVVSATKDLSHKQTLGFYLKVLGSFGMALLWEDNINIWHGQKTLKIAVVANYSRKEIFSHLSRQNLAEKGISLTTNPYYSPMVDSYTQMVDDFMDEFYKKQVGENPISTGKDKLEFIRMYFNEKLKHPQLLALFLLYNKSFGSIELDGNEEEQLYQFLSHKLETEELQTIFLWGGAPRDYLSKKSAEAIDELVNRKTLSITTLKSELGFDPLDLRSPEYEFNPPRPLEITEKIKTVMVPYLIDEFKGLTPEDRVTKFPEMYELCGGSSSHSINNAFFKECQKLFFTDLKSKGNFEERLECFQKINKAGFYDSNFNKQAMNFFVKDIKKAKSIDEIIDIYKKLSKIEALAAEHNRATKAFVDSLSLILSKLQKYKERLECFQEIKNKAGFYGFYNSNFNQQAMNFFVNDIQKAESIDEIIDIYKKLSNIEELEEEKNRATTAFVDSLALMLSKLQKNDRDKYQKQMENDKILDDRFIRMSLIKFF